MSDAAEKIEINPDDFKGPALKIELYNLTDNKKIEAKKEGHQVEFIQFIESDGLSISVPPHSGAKGHELKLEIKLENSEDDIEMSAKAIVIGTEQVEGKNYQMDLQFEEYDRESWVKIISVFSNQQSKLTDLLKALKE